MLSTGLLPTITHTSVAKLSQGATRNLSYRWQTRAMSCCWTKGLNVKRGSLKVIESCIIR